MGDLRQLFLRLGQQRRHFEANGGKVVRRQHARAASAANHRYIRPAKALHEPERHRDVYEFFEALDAQRASLAAESIEGIFRVYPTN